MKTGCVGEETDRKEGRKEGRREGILSSRSLLSPDKRDGFFQQQKKKTRRWWKTGASSVTGAWPELPVFHTSSSCPSVLLCSLLPSSLLLLLASSSPHKPEAEINKTRCQNKDQSSSEMDRETPPQAPDTRRRKPLSGLQRGRLKDHAGVSAHFSQKFYRTCGSFWVFSVWKNCKHNKDAFFSELGISHQ